MNPPSYSPFAVEDQVNVLQRCEAYIRRFCILPEDAYLPLSVWVLATRVALTFDCFPYLALMSPAKRCGKSRLLEVLNELCAKPWYGTAPSPAALFRMMEACPTLLLDEVEALKNTRGASESAQAILAILNAGHRRGATVPRCEGGGHTLRKFPVYGPKAFACIGDLPDTLSDRSICITMQRRTPDQKVERFLAARAHADATPICAAMSRWAEEHKDTVRSIYEKQNDLDWLSDRDADLWMPLFAVCSVVAPDRVPDLKKNAVALSGAKQTQDGENTTSLRLLGDLRRIWTAQKSQEFTSDLIERLRELEESEWDQRLTPYKLSKLLRTFQINSRNVRIDAAVRKGYRLADMEPVWSRYLPQSQENTATSVTSGTSTRETDQIESATSGICSGLEDASSPA
jgi:hypothetical protein